MDSFKYPMSPSEGVEEKLGLFRTNSDGDRNIFSENASNQQYFHPKFMTEVTIKNAQMSMSAKERAHTPPMSSMTSPTISYWHRAPASMKDSQNDIINEIDLDGDKLTPTLPKKSNSARTGELRSRVSDLIANENEGIARKDSIMDSIKKSVRTTVRRVSRTVFRSESEKPASLKAIQLIHDKAASPAEYRSEVSFSKKRRKKVVPRFKQALQKHANYKVDVGSQALFRLWKDVQKIKQSRFGRIKYKLLKLKGSIQLRDYDLWRRFKRLFRIREPEGLFRICWDILCMLIIILDLIGLPVLFTFEDAVDRTFGFFDVIDNVQAIFFIIDIVLNFNTAYYSEGELIMDRKSIARNYIRGWFWIDLLCALPFDALAQTVQDFPDTFDRLKRIKMVRMLRIAKLRKILLRFEEYLGTSRFVNGILSLVNLSMVISFLAHWSACIWYAIGQADDRINWLMEGDFEHGSTTERYVVSLYFAMTTMMTVGYGDIVPSNMGERIYTICLMLVGGGVFGYTMNSIGLILQSLEDEKSKVRRKIYSTSRFMNQQGVNKEVQSEVRKYLEFVLDNEAKSKSAEREMLGLLPPRLQTKVNEQLNRKFVTGNTILMRIFNKKTVQMIASQVEEKVFGVEETVFDTTDTEMSIFYILKGTVGIYHPRSTLPLFALKKGVYFGERSFFSNLQRTIVAKSHDFSQLLYFRREPLLEILQSFPLDKEMFHMVKDSVAVYEDYSALDLCCHICGKKDHVEEICPNIHYVPDKTEIIEEYLEEFESFMQDYQRKPRKKFHVRSNLPRIYEAVHRMRNLPVVQGDMSMPEDSNVFGSPHKSHSLDERSSLLNSPKEKVTDPKPTLRRITIRNIEHGKTEINILESLAGIKLQRTSRNDYKLIEDEEEEEIDELSLFDKMRNYEIYFPHNNFSKQLDPNKANKRKRRMSDIEMLRNHLGRFFKAMERKDSLEHFQ